MPRLPRYMRSLEFLLLALGVLLLVCAGTYKLSEAPGVWFDEGLYTQASAHLIEYGTEAIQIAPSTFASNTYLTVGYPLFFPVGLSYKLFGVGVVQGRFVMVLFTIAFAAAAYALVRMLFGSSTAAWTFLLLASFPVLYGNGKPVLGEVPGMFFLVLTCLGILILEKDNFKSRWAYVGTGLAAGLCIATKPIFLLLLPALLVVGTLHYRSIVKNWGGFLLGVVAFILPLLVWEYLQFGGDATVAKQLEYYIGSPYVIDNRAALALTNFLQFFRDIKSVYSVTVPAVLWVASLFLRKKREESIASVEWGMLVFCAFVLLHYLTIMGYSRYYFPAQLVLLLFLPYSITEVFRYISSRFLFLQKVQWLPCAAVSVLIVWQLLQLVHGSYVAGYYTSTKTHDVRSALAALEPGSSFFLVNVPEVAILLPSRNYYQYVDAAQDLKIGAEEVPALTEGKADYAIVVADSYAKDPAPFGAYTPAFMAGGYEVLKSKTHK